MRARAQLVDLDADLLGDLTVEERHALTGIAVPTVLLAGREPLDLTSLRAGGAFAAILLEGMVFHHLQIGVSPGLRILGPGDLLALREDLPSDLIVGSRWRAAPKTTIALLGRETMIAARHVPQLLVGLQDRAAEQVMRVATQLVISQLPRVEDRLLAMLWLLAESFGTVTPSGTALPLALTHEMLGALVGARRPTVSLALRSLSETGGVVHRDEGWLLVERPAKPEVSPVSADEPRIIKPAHSDWLIPLAPDRSARIDPGALGALSDTVERLRVQHLRNLDRTGERQRRTAEVSRRSAELRARIRRERRLRTSQLPSS